MFRQITARHTPGILHRLAFAIGGTVPADDDLGIQDGREQDRQDLVSALPRARQ